MNRYRRSAGLEVLNSKRLHQSKKKGKGDSSQAALNNQKKKLVLSSTCMSRLKISLNRNREQHTGSVCLWKASSLDFRTAAVSSFLWVRGSPVTYKEGIRV